jgi:hypothetical protein
MTDVRLGSGVDAVAERATSTEVGQTGISVDDFTVVSWECNCKWLAAVTFVLSGGPA